jgi:hypothetical protein
MQHPINNLNDAGLDMLCDRLTEIAVALDDNNIYVMERVERILPVDVFNELRAYLGTIREAQHTICELLYGSQELLVNESLAHCPVCDQDTTLPLGCTICDPANPDACDPFGIERPIMTDVEAAALIEVLDTEDAAIALNAVRDDLLAKLDRGVITMSEFHAGLHVNNIPQYHRCTAWGCKHNVPFDDEPVCYGCSPDSGSSVRGYSYMLNVKRAQHTVESLNDGFVM